MAPGHYLNLCWLIIIKVQWHSSEDNFKRDTMTSIIKISLQISYLIFPINLQGTSELNLIYHITLNIFCCPRGVYWKICCYGDCFLPDFEAFYPLIPYPCNMFAQPSGVMIDQFHKSLYAPFPYPRMLRSKQKCSYFCSEWSILGVGNRCILGFVN